MGLSMSGRFVIAVLIVVATTAALVGVVLHTHYSTPSVHSSSPNNTTTTTAGVIGPKESTSTTTSTSSLGGSGEIESKGSFGSVSEYVRKYSLELIENYTRYATQSMQPAPLTVTLATTTTVSGALEMGARETYYIGKELGSASSFSETNVQVPGVDEEDIVKTNGSIIVVASRDAVYLIKPLENGSMKITGEINVTNDIAKIGGVAKLLLQYDGKTVQIAAGRLKAYVIGLYLYNGRVVVIANAYHSFYWLPIKWINSERGVAPPYIPPFIVKPTVWVLVYSVNGKLLHYAWITGSEVNSRMINNTLIVVSRSEPIYWIMPLRASANEAVRSIKLPPAYTSWGVIPVNSTVVASVPPSMYTIVMKFNVDTGSKSAVCIYGSPSNIVYMTSNGIVYLLSTCWWPLPTPIKVGGASSTVEVYRHYPSTVIVRVDARNGLRVTNTTVLEGSASSQFAIDVHNGVLRLALQLGWNKGFNIYTLNATTLARIGELRNVAVGESVKGLRFIGDKLYIVTYREVDPLFTIDLSNPAKPKILGFVKGPGFDQYLHPYNNTILIGVGYTGNRELRVTIYKLLENGSVSIISRLVLGKSYAYQLFYSKNGYHSFILDRKHHYIMFPVAKVEPINITRNGETRIIWKWESGVYIISYEPSSLKLGLKGFLKHDGALREIYINNTIYTVSRSLVKSWNALSLEEMCKLKLM